MYCVNEEFTTAIDYGNVEQKLGWNIFADTIKAAPEEQYKSFIEKIEIGGYLQEDQ